MKFPVLVGVLLLAACVESRGPSGSAPVLPPEAGACQDTDGDGFGEGCAAGGDCNDTDNKVHNGCSECVTPQQGCGCKDSDKPVSCYLSPTADEIGTVMCHEGTRYCRTGHWSACESVVTYPKPEELDPQALVGSSGSSHCNDCNINCYVIRDNLDPVDAGIDGSAMNAQLADGGGLTLTYTLPEAGATVDAGTFDPSLCILGTAPDHDCDGIPDTYDPYPNTKPFATANPTIFLDIAPGATGTGVVDLSFYLNSADIYFLVDQTGSMAEERDQLVHDLVTGDFINNAAFNCADTNFDFQPDNGLKTQGIAGAINCIIRDANFGVGYFREIPFSTHGSNDQVTYRNLQDITNNFSLLNTGVSRLNTVGNSDWPEASAVALYHVATGNGMFVGNRGGLLPRTGCPSLAWGYPCFREKAIPIVILFTDAQFHNGPTYGGTSYAYSSSYSTSVGSSTSYSPVSPTNENWTTAFDIGDLTTKYNSYIGQTYGMTSDLPHGDVSCGPSPAEDSPDALFKFTLSSTKTVTLTTQGSDFDTTLSLFRNTTPMSSLASYPNTNDNGGNAYAFTGINNKYVQASGNSSGTGITSDYSANDVSCSAAPGAKDATFTFAVSGSTLVALDTTGSGYGTVVGLFSGTPTTTTYTPITGNDKVSSISAAGSVSSNNLGFSGDTSASGMTANYSAATLGCAADPPAAGSPDAVYSFTLGSSTRVRLSAEDSALDAELALLDSTGTLLESTAVTGNETSTAGVVKDIGALDGNAYQYTGNTTGMSSDYTQAVIGCNAGNSAPDAVYKFTLTGTKTVSIDTLTSGFDTVLGLFKTAISSPDTLVTVPSTPSPQANEIGSSAISLGTVNGQRFIVSGGNTTGMTGNYSATTVSCGNGSNDNSPDAVFSFHLSSNTTVRIDTNGSAFDTILSVHSAAAIASSNRKGCADGGGLDTLDSQLDLALTTGDYWVVVKGRKNSKYGAYTLTVQDLSSPPANNKIACNDDYSTGNTSLLSQSLTSGTYYVVVKGSGTASGAYTLTIRDTAVALASSYACNHTSGAGGKALIEQTLAAGTYRVVVKGKSATGGPYKLIMRDLTQLPTKNLGCNYNSATDGRSHLETTLATGTYTVVLKGDAAGAAGGAYNLSVRDASNIGLMDTALACNDDASSSTYTSSISTSLGAGTYFAAVKGVHTTDAGNYQLNIGAVSTTTGSYSPPSWATTLAALQAKQMRVLTVLSCHDDNSPYPGHGDTQGDCVATREQAKSIANATGALGSNLAPLVFDISKDGTGLSKTVVDGVAALAHYLEMNVSLRVVFDPDANPGFGVVVRAIDEPGDGCSGLVGLEHQHCVPGASPRFEIAFTNPSGLPVPLNSHDPNGGYNFRAELIGDNQFIVDRVPIYIIPRNVTHAAPPVPQVAASGSYWQDVSSAGCVGNQRPDWHDLTWTADVPQGTSIAFNVCASDKTTALTNCPLTTLCTISGGIACTTNSQCGNGFCSTAGNCQTVTANACASDTDCSAGGHCRSAKCTFDSQPVYVGGVLGSANYATNLRMNIAMTGNTTANVAPTVHDWSLTYVCNNIL